MNLALLTSFFILLLMDVCYIYIIKVGYMNMIQKVQNGDDINIQVYAVILSYIFVICGLVFYVIPYAQKVSRKSKLYTALTIGGLYGVLVYGVYNTTNLALFKHFSFTHAVGDILWGGILYTIATLVYLSLAS